MGSSLASDSSLLFYPTEYSEQIRIFSLLGKLEMKSGYRYDDASRKELRDYVGFYHKTIEANALDFDSFWQDAYFDHFLKQKDFDALRKFFGIDMSAKGGGSIVISDLFAGKGEWLKSFSTFEKTKTSYNDYSITYVGNEIEENRYNEMKKGVKYHFNLPFEEITLPKNYCSLYLFNPPYARSNDERNARRYLRMTIEKGYIAKDLGNRKNGMIVSILNKKDTIENLDLFVKHFDIITLYKTQPEEYEKFKQIVLVAIIRDKPHNLENLYEAGNYKQRYDKWMAVLEGEPEFSLRNYRECRQAYFWYPTFSSNEIDLMFENVKYIRTAPKFSNPNSRAWKLIKERTEISQESLSQLTMPKVPKVSEIAQIMAAGYTRGDFVNARIPHISVGGTKLVTKTEQVKYKNAEGEDMTETKTIRQSMPYLNLLYTKDGKIIIKELAG
jgi:hypothetical protein